VAAALPEHDHHAPGRLDLLDQLDPQIGERALQRPRSLD
jgi:hypothetical protein